MQNKMLWCFLEQHLQKYIMTQAIFAAQKHFSTYYIRLHFWFNKTLHYYCFFFFLLWLHACEIESFICVRGTFRKKNSCYFLANTSKSKTYMCRGLHFFVKKNKKTLADLQCSKILKPDWGQTGNYYWIF